MEHMIDRRAWAAVSCVAPELQNLSGKNLFCFSLALVGKDNVSLTVYA
jgi:hypothetical protein